MVGSDQLSQVGLRLPVEIVTDRIVFDVRPAGSDQISQVGLRLLDSAGEVHDLGRGRWKGPDQSGRIATMSLRPRSCARTTVLVGSDQISQVGLRLPQAGVGVVAGDGCVGSDQISQVELRRCHDSVEVGAGNIGRRK